MIRFVDLRGQNIPRRFAFWSRSAEAFIEYDHQNSWHSWRDFEEDYNSTIVRNSELDEFKKLCPDWVFEDSKNKSVYVLVTWYSDGSDTPELFVVNTKKEIVEIMGQAKDEYKEVSVTKINRNGDAEEIYRG